jgi:3'(2'), 5'-bisphosphate nucleotidase
MDSLLTTARECANEAARIIAAAYGDVAFTNKADTSPVTETDRRVHDFLLEALLPTGIPVLSEEGHEVTHPYPEHIWIIDPIDGTQGFINGTGDFAVMIGLLEKGRPVLGVVHMPATNTQYYATKDGGAFMSRNGVTSPLTVSNRRVPDLHALLSVNHFLPYMTSILTALEVDTKTHIGGIGVKAGMLAEGTGDYFLTLGNLGEWDVCAPEIIVLEAGGSVTDQHGDPIRYDMPDSKINNGVVFTNGACHREVLTALMLALRPVE